MSAINQGAPQWKILHTPPVQNRITSDSAGSLPGQTSLVGDVHKVVSYLCCSITGGCRTQWKVNTSIFSTSLKKTAHLPFSVLSFHSFPEDTRWQVSLCVCGGCTWLIAVSPFLSILLSPRRDADLVEEPSSVVRREAASPGPINNHK